jgi:thiamine biosynthesis lipoprotein
MSITNPLLHVHYFKHEAMNTTFHLRLKDIDETCAQSVAKLCIERIDQIESYLSRYQEGSNISQINSLQEGETLYLQEDCHLCLLTAIEAYQKTAGLFDITLGTWIQHRKSKETSPPPELTGNLTIHSDTPAVTCITPGRQLDLGGIGKGFALDALRAILTDWGVPSALLGAGDSSIIAFGPDAWPIDCGYAQTPLRITLQNQSLSSSGTSFQGEHIINPSLPEAQEGALKSNHVWVVANNATWAEVWSTTFMMIPQESIAEWACEFPEIMNVFTEVNQQVTQVYPAHPHV